MLSFVKATSKHGGGGGVEVPGPCTVLIGFLTFLCYKLTSGQSYVLALLLIPW